MKIKRILSLCSVLILLILCSGCSLNFFSVESLMSAPAQSGKNGEVESAFKKLMAEKSIQLCTPSNGDYQTAYVLFDINGDSAEEAFVFYSEPTVDTSVRMTMLECINETWVISKDIKGAGSSIYEISFEDLNGDGVYEVFVGWSLYDSKTAKIANAFQVVQGENGVSDLKALGTEYYNSKSFLDFNGDGKTDWAIVYLDDSGETQKSYFRCFSLSDRNELVKYGEVRIAGSVTQVSSIQWDTATNGSDTFKRVFVDCIKTENTMFTEMIYWDAKKSQPVRSNAEAASKTLRSAKVICRDIDGDGLLEIPVNTKLNGNDGDLNVKISDNFYTFSMLKWLGTVGDKSEGNVFTLFNPMDSYLYRTTHANEITVRYDSYRQALLFCIWDDEEKVVRDELLSVSYRGVNDKTETQGEELYSSEHGVYYYNITSYGEEFGITDEGVIASFIYYNN